jgi:hypothetical protein
VNLLAESAEAERQAAGLTSNTLPINGIVDAQWVACKLTSTGQVVQCTTADVDTSVIGVSYFSRSDHSVVQTIPLTWDARQGFPALFDGFQPLNPGDPLTLSPNAPGRFALNGNGAFRALTGAPFNFQDSLIRIVPIYSLAYVPVNSAAWNGTNPTSIQNALDRIAAVLGVIP